MAFPFEHYLLVMGGPLGDSEEWTTSLRISSADAGATTASEQAALLDLAAAISPIFARTSTAGGPMSAKAKLAWLKYNRIGTDGRYVRSVTNVHDLPAPIANTGAQLYPHQVAIVATLETSVSRGLAAKGRMFLPSPRFAGVQGDFTLAPADVASAAAWVRDLLDAINTTASVGDVVVMSKGGVDRDGTPRAGVSRPVTGVNVGSVLDTMRSRRGKLVETRQSEALVNPGTGGTF